MYGFAHWQVCWVLMTLIITQSCFPDALPAQSRVEELVDIMSLEQLMSLEASSTSFFDTPIEKTPGSLYIIPRETLDFSYAQSLSDYLAYYVPGAHISQFYDQGTLYSTRGFSGGTNATALFMLDSESLNSSRGMSFNLNLPLLGYADRVEVLNGPCSVLHGSGSVNGFVNIIHKNGKDHPGSFVSMESGLNNGQVLMEAGHGVSGTGIGDVYIYAGAVKSDDLDTPAKASDAFTEPSFRTSLNWRKDKLSLTAFIHQEEFESGLTDPLKDIDAGYPLVRNENYAILPRFRSDITETEDITISLPLKYFKDSFEYSGSDLINFYGRELEFEANMLIRTTRLDDHRIAVGGALTFCQREQNDRQYDFRSVSAESDNELSIADLSFDMSWVALSAFVEDMVQLSPQLSLFCGLRFDSIHNGEFELEVDEYDEAGVDISGNYDQVFTPRIGLTYELSASKVVKFMYQQGYNYPDFVSRITENITKDICTEKVESFELGYHQTLHAMAGTKCEFNFNAYYNIFNDTALQGVNQDGSRGFKAIIVDRFAAVGFEASVVLCPFKGMKMDASYGFSRPFDINGGELIGTLTNSYADTWIIYPEHTLKLNITKTFLENRLDIILGCLYNNSVSTIGKEDDVENDVFDHHRLVVNAAARYRVSDVLALTFRAHNILNNDTPATGYYYYWGFDTQNNSFTRAGVYAGLECKF